MVDIATLDRLNSGLAKRRILLSRLALSPLMVLAVFSTSHWELEKPMLTALLFLVGCVFVGTATIGRLWCALYISGYKKRTLITQGPYSLCRNPLYFFSLFGGIGVGLTTETLTIPVVLGILFAVYYPVVIAREERKLAAIHHRDYTGYLHSVPSFLPRRLRMDEPEQYIVKPSAFRKNLMDALWFIWLVGLIEFAEALKGAGILPALWRLY